MTRAYNTATTQQNSGGAVAPMTAGKNFVINGGFDIWQRGTSLSYSASGTPYGPDRFTIYSGNTGTVSRQVTGDTTNLPNIQYSARTQRTSGQTSTLAFYFGESLETVNSIPLVGKTITFSYYARKGANYSGTALTAYLKQSTGTDQNYVTGSMTGETVLSAIDINSNITTTWQRFSTTVTVTTAATQVGFYFDWRPSGTAGANDWFEVTGIQLEIGSVATPFSRAGGTIQGELAACQRYYQRKNSTGNGTIFGMGQCQNTTNAYYLIPTPVVFRTAPSFAQSGVNGWTASTGNAGGTIAVFCMSADAVTVGLTGGNSLVAGNASALAGTTSSAYIELSAEL
jgi:hypothetical protein